MRNKGIVILALTAAILAGGTTADELAAGKTAYGKTAAYGVGVALTEVTPSADILRDPE